MDFSFTEEPREASIHNSPVVKHSRRVQTLSLYRIPRFWTDVGENSLCAFYLHYLHCFCVFCYRYDLCNCLWVFILLVIVFKTVDGLGLLQLTGIQRHALQKKIRPSIWCFDFVSSSLRGCCWDVSSSLLSLNTRNYQLCRITDYAMLYNWSLDILLISLFWISLNVCEIVNCLRLYGPWDPEVRNVSVELIVLNHVGGPHIAETNGCGDLGIQIYA